MDLDTDLSDDAVFDNPSEGDVIAAAVVAMMHFVRDPFRYSDADRLLEMMDEAVGGHASGVCGASAGMNRFENTSKITTEVEMAISATLKM